MIISVRLFKFTQRITREYGRLSALPHHVPTHVEEEIRLGHNMVDTSPGITGSAFQCYTDDQDEIQTAYVTYHPTEAEITNDVVDIDTEEFSEEILNRVVVA